MSLRKRKCAWIKFQEHDEMAQSISPWIPIPIKSTTFVKDMAS